MDVNTAEINAYQKKVNAQLEEAKANLEALAAKAKGKLAQSEIDAIKHLKTKREEIDRKLHHDLKTVVEVKAADQIKAHIDAEVTKFKTDVDQLTAKIKGQAATSNT